MQGPPWVSATCALFGLYLFAGKFFPYTNTISPILLTDTGPSQGALLLRRISLFFLQLVHQNSPGRLDAAAVPLCTSVSDETPSPQCTHGLIRSPRSAPCAAPPQVRPLPQHSRSFLSDKKCDLRSSPLVTASRAHGAALGNGSGFLHVGFPPLPSPPAGPSPRSPPSVQPNCSSPGTPIAVRRRRSRAQGSLLLAGGVPLLPGLPNSPASPSSFSRNHHHSLTWQKTNPGKDAGES